MVFRPNGIYFAGTTSTIFFPIQNKSRLVVHPSFLNILIYIGFLQISSRRKVTQRGLTSFF